MKTLENKPQLLVTNPRHIPIIQRIRPDIINNHPTTRRLIQQSHNIQHRTLSTSRRSHDSHKLTFLHRQVNIFQCPCLHLARVKRFINIL